MGQAVSDACGCCGNLPHKVQRVPLNGDKTKAASPTTPRPEPAQAPLKAEDTEGEAWPPSATAGLGGMRLAEPVTFPEARSAYDGLAFSKEADSARVEDSEAKQAPELTGLMWAKAQGGGEEGPGAGETGGSTEDGGSGVLQLETRPAWMRPGAEGTGYVMMPEDDIREDTGEEEAVSSKPTRSLGCCGMIRRRRKPLSQGTRDKIGELFELMDRDRDGEVTREEALQFFKQNGHFGGLSAKAMFNEVDTDESQSITVNEFFGFWEQVHQSGYTDGQLNQEITQILRGGAWVDWKDGREVQGGTGAKKMSHADSKL